MFGIFTHRDGLFLDTVCQLLHFGSRLLMHTFRLHLSPFAGSGKEEVDVYYFVSKDNSVDHVLYLVSRSLVTLRH